jgi:hypothetical protein
MPNVVVNIPDFTAMHPAHNSLRQSPTPHITSDPADYIDEPWPSLHNFLLNASTKDRHKRDFISHKETLRNQEILRPDDIVRCSAEELHETCAIPLGTAKLLVAEGQRVSQHVKSEAQACKCQQTA